MQGYRIGCDIGGTFTDIILYNDKTQEMYIHKLLSSPHNFAESVIRGTKEIIERHGVDPREVEFFCHSSTVAINTLVERKGGATALLTTEGFRDVLEIGRGTREHEYDLFQKRPEPLSPRNLRFGVEERIDYQGNVLIPLNEQQVLDIARRLKEEGVTSIAVSYLHSYANPAHERRTKELILSVMPEAFVSLSSEINPVYREYERTSSTVINAYVSPKCIRYLTELEKELRNLGFTCPLYITQSSGGLMTSRAAKERNIHMLMAGPAAGVIASAFIAKHIGADKVIALDTGGTTQLISLVENGTINPIIDSKVSGHPVQIPIVDVRAIGAGGGSIARVDSGGKLFVGPDSAGSSPGPVCYGRGGEEPTVTDADVVLGYLNPDFFLGGDIRLDKEKAEEAIYEKIAKPLGMNLYKAAAGIIEVVNSERISSIRKLLIEQGYDPRDFVMVAFGGAGPVHASELAKELELKAVIVPNHPGLLSPLGSLSADLRRDHVQTVNTPLGTLDMKRLSAIFDEVREKVVREMVAEGVDADRLDIRYQVDVKYAKQLNELTIDVTQIDNVEGIRRAFFEEHRRLFGYHAEDEEVFLTNVRVMARFAFPEVRLKKLPAGGPDSSHAKKGERLVYFKEYRKMIDCRIYDRSKLLAGNVVEGPAIVEEYDSTSVIFPGQKATVDEYGNLVITKKEE